MKQKASFFLFRIMAVAMIALSVLTSCNPTEDSLLSSIPVDKPCVVVSIDLDKFIDAAQITIEDGKVTVPDYIQKSPLLEALLPQGDPKGVVELLTDFSKNINNEFVVAYSNDEGDSFLTYQIDNGNGYDNWMEENLDMSTERDENGIVFVQTKSGRNVWFAKRGKTGWLMKGDPEKLVAILERAKKVNASKLSGIRNYFNDSECVHFAYMMSPGTDPNGQKSLWRIGDLNFEGNRVYGEELDVYGDGELLKRAYVSQVSTDFLRYVPDSMSLVLAVGHNGKSFDVDNNQEFELIRSRLDAFGFGQYLDIAKPYINAIDGTVAAALKFDFSKPQPQFQGAVLIAHMSQSMVNNTLSQIKMLASQMNVPITTTDKTGEFSIDLSSVTGTPLTLSCANRDGYLMLSTYSLSGEYNNSYARYFTGKDGACVVNIPSLAFLTPNVSEGLQLVAEAKLGGGEYKAEFTGSETPFLETLMAILNSLAIGR